MVPKNQKKKERETERERVTHANCTHFFLWIKLYSCWHARLKDIQNQNLFDRQPIKNYSNGLINFSYFSFYKLILVILSFCFMMRYFKDLARLLFQQRIFLCSISRNRASPKRMPSLHSPLQHLILLSRAYRNRRSCLDREEQRKAL